MPPRYTSATAGRGGAEWRTGGLDLTEPGRIPRPRGKGCGVLNRRLFSQRRSGSPGLALGAAPPLGESQNPQLPASWVCGHLHSGNSGQDATATPLPSLPLLKASKMYYRRRLSQSEGGTEARTNYIVGWVQPRPRIRQPVTASLIFLLPVEVPEMTGTFLQGPQLQS